MRLDVENGGQGSPATGGPAHHSFVLFRHGESAWNAADRFTGWTDVPLTDAGRQEARQVGQALRRAGCTFDLAVTSVLQRAVESLTIVLDELGRPDLPVLQDWRLNERHYGCLQGLGKADTVARLGSRRVGAWRRGYSERPPALEWDDRRHPRFDPRYAGLPPAQLPRAESLQDTVARLLPCWQAQIAPALRRGRRVLCSAHGNSLRALVAYLENIPAHEIPAISIPTGACIAYQLELDLSVRSRYDIFNPGGPDNV
ncbi:MAG: 2,3-bisphosphoglycerate-dependent phosphoglycerate mutase [Chloroflexota bacterium]